MQVKFWGTRGSLPYTMMPNEWVKHFERLMSDFFEKGYSSKKEIPSYIEKIGDLNVGDVGSATTCVVVTSKSKNLIIDAGSGIKNYGDFLKNQSHIKQHHILMTHFHYDHVLGAPFFYPNYEEDHEIHYYFVQDEGEQNIKQLFRKPFFPVPFEALSAKIFFHKLRPHEKNKIQHFEVTPYLTDHPDDCYGFKISDGESSYSHAVDNECLRLSRNSLGKDAGLYENTDLLYIDVQFNQETYRHGWGHGTLEKALSICTEFNISRTVFGHHDLTTRFSDLQNIEKKYLLLNKMRWQWAYDGLSIHLGSVN